MKDIQRLMVLLKQQNMKEKKQKGGFLGPVLPSLAASLAQRVISSVVKDVTGRGVMRAGRGYNCGTLILLRLNIFHKMY